MKGVFITATDTSVGKTYVACRLTEFLKQKKIKVGVLKPFSSGTRADALKLIKASGVKEPVEKVNPVFFKNPLAPMVAAKIENRKIDLSFFRKALKGFQKKYEFMVVEGAGGVMVPVTEKIFISDVIKAAGFPVIVVARPSLGTLNHTILTVDKLKRDGAKVLGVVLSGRKKNGLAEKTNPKALRNLLGLPVLELTHGKKFTEKQIKSLKLKV